MCAYFGLLDTGTNVAHTKKFLGCKCQPPCLKMTGTLPAGATLLTCVLQASTSATNSTESPGSENVQGTVLTLLLILDTWTSFVISWLPCCGELLPSSRTVCVHTPCIRLGFLMPKIHCEECARFWPPPSPPFFASSPALYRRVYSFSLVQHKETLAQVGQKN